MKFDKVMISWIFIYAIVFFIFASLLSIAFSKPYIDMFSFLKYPIMVVFGYLEYKCVQELSLRHQEDLRACNLKNDNK